MVYAQLSSLASCSCICAGKKSRLVRVLNAVGIRSEYCIKIEFRYFPDPIKYSDIVRLPCQWSRVKTDREPSLYFLHSGHRRCLTMNMWYSLPVSRSWHIAAWALVEHHPILVGILQPTAVTSSTSRRTDFLVVRWQIIITIQGPILVEKKKTPKRQEILVKLTLVHQPARCGWTRNIWRVRDGSERWITIPQEHVDQWDVIYLVGPARYPCQRATVSLDFMMLSTTLKMDCYCSGYWVTMIIFVSHLCDNITYQKNLLTPTQMRSSQDSTKVVINETMS